MSSPQEINGGVADNTTYTTIRQNVSRAIKGPNIESLLRAIATGTDKLAVLAQAIFDQLFVSTAQGRYLSRLGEDNGVTRPWQVGIGDAQFAELVITLKNNRGGLEDVHRLLEIFYGPTAVRAFIQTSAAEPYDLSGNPDLYLSLNGAAETRLTFEDDDFTAASAATALEVAVKITKTFRDLGVAGYAVPYTDPDTTATYVRVYSAVVGLESKTQQLGGAAQNVLRFPSLVNTTQAPSTGFNITASPTNQNAVRFEYNGGDDPSLWLVREGDVANVYGAVFSDFNKGRYIVSAATRTYFEAIKPEYNSTHDEAVSLTDASDIEFFRPDTANTYSDGYYAVAAQPDYNKLVVEYPVTSDAVVRGLGTGGYLAGNTPQTVQSFARAANGDLTLTFAQPHGLTVGDWLLTDGLYFDLNIEQADTGFTPAAVSPATLAPPYPAVIYSASAVMQDGRVLVCGGSDATTIYAKAAIFDPVTNLWSYAADMGVARTRHTATALPNGAVLVVGGLTTGPAATATAEYYDPGANTWTPISVNMTQARYGHTATLTRNGFVLVAGGCSVNTLETYNIGNKHFAPYSDKMRYPRRYHTATLLTNNLVMLVGGLNPYGQAIDYIETFNVENLNITYTQTTKRLPARRARGSAIFARDFPNGRTLFSGGTDQGLPRLTENTSLFPMLARWNFDESYLPFLDDFSGLQLNSTTPPTIVPGYVGTGVFFDGINGLFTPNMFLRSRAIGVDLAAALATSFTVAFWVKPSSPAAATPSCLVGCGVNPANGPDVKLFKIIMDAAQTITVEIGGNSATSVGTIPLDAWTLIGVAYDGTNAEITFDGVLDSTPALASVTGGEDSTFYFGNGPSAVSMEVFFGLIDEVTVFQDPWPDTDLAAFYTTATTPITAAPGASAWLITPGSFKTTEVPTTGNYYDHKMVQVGSNIHLVGENATANGHEIYVPSVRAWHLAKDDYYNWGPTTARYAAVVEALPDGRILLALGYDDTAPEYLNDAELFKPWAVKTSGRANGLFRVSATPTGTTAVVGTYAAFGTSGTGGSITPLKAGASMAGEGVFIYDPVAGVAVTGVSTALAQNIVKGETYRAVTVLTTTGFAPKGYVVFDFGGPDQESPVPYVAVPNSNTIVFDVGYTFKHDFAPNTTITRLVSASVWVPETPQVYGGLYLTGSTSAQEYFINALDSAVAAGVNVAKQPIFPGDKGLGNSGGVENPAKPSDKFEVWAG